MNPVNATTLYVSACRSVLQCDPRDPRALAELYKQLPFFRQSLSCLVCGNLLQDPIAPTNSQCQHYVCRGCKGQRMLLKPSCSWCKDYSRFQENRQLSLLVHCYRKLCLYIAQSPLAPHIASAASDSPDLLAILNEGLSLAESEQEEEDTMDLASQSPPTAPSISDLRPTEALPAEESQEEGLIPVGGVNGLHDCNGLANQDLPPPITLATGGGVLKQESLGEELPVCVDMVGSGEVGLCNISTFGEELNKHGGGLLLSVEEVLRTLEPEPNPELPDQPDIPLYPHNGSYCPPTPDSPRLTPSLPPEDIPRLPLPPPQPTPALPRLPPHCHRKRSRSESDSEKVHPLPIATILRGPPLGATNPLHLPIATVKREPKLPSAITPPHLAPVPNGGPPKVGKTMLVSSKGLKKSLEHHGGPKKAYTKARQGVPKPRAQPRDRLPPHGHAHPLSHPPSPSKPLYKKPVEKKGCKCGRATQNPSVLTCRGQRCPCYSNRKACLDCICRGCQNSYMANGEKKLEAFAVPEKALEQTRLTLGINLTSITAAALRSPATSNTPHGNQLITTATGATGVSFLSGVGPGHEDRGYDDSLDLRFDC
ncbi:LOW QUALITY PROTEIN: E3 ubiquitin-protein ligase MSL2-like [Oncorhynchus keta]|uniref:LOW QUALITY PROTEIN: E3 ubiquitin-protein ligase MSL2-like n=1 Tax=Oncorhynchus keta TaxID=8018 RepID=UPI00227D03C6|nr:LOW QUALITY PROTEIN: E3 ubiquitin-protein ligase MSL2-like [Oncorhynchus keta]